jgi:hypothetical protein
MPPPAPEKRRSFAGVVRWTLKIILTCGLLYVFYVSFWIVRVFLESEEPSGYVPPGGAGITDTDRRVSSPRVRMPWTTYPGAKEVRRNETIFNGSPFLTERFEAAGTNSEILSYYRRTLRNRGWRDVTEEHFGIDPGFFENGAPVNLQNQEFLLRYEETVRSNLAMQLGEKLILVEVDMGSKSWKRRVSLSQQGRSRQTASLELAKRLRFRSRGRIEPYFRAQQHIGKDDHTTEFYHSRFSVNRLHRKLVRRMKSKGWEQEELPDKFEPEGIDGMRVSFYVKKADYAILNVYPSPTGRGSAATLMKVDSAL